MFAPEKEIPFRKQIKRALRKLTIRRPQRRKSCLLTAVIETLEQRQLLAASPDFVIHIVADGLRPDAVTRLGATALPWFYKFRKEGAFTDDARTDVNHTVTLPNHTTMISGWTVVDNFGTATAHHVIENNDENVCGNPAWDLHQHDLHTTGGPAEHTDYYIPSVYDVVHDQDLPGDTGPFPTAMYSRKYKFDTWNRTWDSDTGYLEGGAIDVTGTAYQPTRVATRLPPPGTGA